MRVLYLLLFSSFLRFKERYLDWTIFIKGLETGRFRGCMEWRFSRFSPGISKDTEFKHFCSFYLKSNLVRLKNNQLKYTVNTTEDSHIHNRLNKYKIDV